MHRSPFASRGASVVWLTGLSGAGKTTLAQALAQRLRAAGEPCLVIDGDVLRQGLCSDLGFGSADRKENMRRASEVARLLVDNGCWAIVALISPFAAEREQARARIGVARFVEVHVHAPLPVLEIRDPKGLYARARAGTLLQMSGLDAPYEAPAAPSVFIDTSSCTPDQATERLLAALLP